MKTILLIEDDIEIRDFVAQVFELEGYNVLVTPDGIVGMEILRNTPVSLVILSLKLPGLDVWRILRDIKRNPEFSSIPMAVLTAIAVTIQCKRTLYMGDTSYLVKPVSAYSLSRAIADVLYGKSCRYQGQEVPEMYPVTAKEVLRFTRDS